MEKGRNEGREERERRTELEKNRVKKHCSIFGIASYVTFHHIRVKVRAERVIIKRREGI